MSEKIVCSSLQQVADNAKSKGITALRAFAQECTKERGSHSFVHLSQINGPTVDYCAYCLALRINGTLWSAVE
jgi:hypothetical protein